MALARWNPMMPWRPSQDPWSPFTGMESLRSEMERLFDAFSGTMAPSGTHEAQPFQHVSWSCHAQSLCGLTTKLPTSAGYKDDGYVSPFWLLVQQ